MASGGTACCVGPLPLVPRSAREVTTPPHRPALLACEDAQASSGASAEHRDATPLGLCLCDSPFHKVDTYQVLCLPFPSGDFVFFFLTFHYALIKCSTFFFLHFLFPFWVKYTSHTLLT